MNDNVPSQATNLRLVSTRCSVRLSEVRTLAARDIRFYPGCTHSKRVCSHVVASPLRPIRGTICAMLVYYQVCICGGGEQRLLEVG